MSATVDRQTGEITARAGVLGLDPEAPARVPSEDAFDGGEFFADAALERFVLAVRERHNMGDDYLLAVRWKKNGGDRNGAATLGKCVKLSGHAKHFAGVDYLIWFAADHLAEHGFTNWQLQALAFHELLHVAVDDDEKSDEPVRKVRAHDAELFVQEFREYGAWKLDLTRVVSAVEQMPLGL